MILLVVGLLLFLGLHSIQIVAPGVRAGVVARLGAGPWKGLYALGSLIGLVLVVKGYAATRDAPPLWTAPSIAPHLTAALVPVAFVLIVAAYWPRNHIKRALGDPMVLGVGVWAAAHLIVKATPGALALFGTFLCWATAEFVSLRTRDEDPDAPPAPEPTLVNSLLAFIVGIALAGAFAMFGHKLLIGVSPLG
jgi:uncharacterized membrane protein